MKTIKTKLFLIFMLLMALLILSGILLNSLFLEHYYIYKNKTILINTSQTIKDQYISNSNIENSYDSIDTISLSYGIDTLIVDENYNIEYNSFDLKRMHMKKFIDKPTYQAISNFKNGLSQNTVLYVRENESKNKLVCVTNIDKSKYLILTKNVKTIEDSVQIANEFYLIAGLIVFSAGSLFILFFSKKITKPIVEMSNVAENISNLEFDKIVHVNSQDEIGALGESINKISYKLNKSINELKRDVDRRKSFLRNISHELKTPIGIIKGYSEGLKYGLAKDKTKIDKYCSVLVEECDKMNKLIQELLDYSLMEDGLIKLNITDFDINEFLNDALKRFTPILEEQKINLTLNCSESYILKADKEMLEKALNNFITNAIKYTDAKKSIIVTSQLIEDNIRISVFNTGKSIPENELKNIWDVYYKIDKARTRDVDSHGIGLSLVKLIATLHNGNCKAENIENGVLFFIEIPLVHCEN
ncbi:HAMP domain-containing sensor histidine kinase [Clostridium sp. LQ25]|uniref:sensor histidine kinase n=1 Tax=Clostridium sp. LQ25 TaxID=2992805 RepID=UPI00224F1945|nr:HAMP domain-containing sensor histidine kinase [Clostridium sp. LQ25]UZT08577.1 HAMP domain-containing sensor histidine kinase [Clostridium sp. LQ25]